MVIVMVVGLLVVTVIHRHSLILGPRGHVVEAGEAGQAGPHPQLPVDALPGVYQDARVHKVKVPGVRQHVLAAIVPGQAAPHISVQVCFHFALLKNTIVSLIHLKDLPLKHTRPVQDIQLCLCSIHYHI